MVNSCVICQTKQVKGSSIALHRFPKNQEACQLWKKICGFYAEDDVSTLCICSNHFTPSDYIDSRAKQLGGRMSLMLGAYPSIFNRKKKRRRHELVSVDISKRKPLINNHLDIMIQGAGIKDEMTDDVSHDNTNIEQVYIKSEPVDTSEYEDKLESTAVAKTENCDPLETNCTLSSEHKSYYNYNTNIIITEETDIKSECADGSECEDSAAEQDSAGRTSCNNSHESADELLSIKKFGQHTTPNKCDIYKNTFEGASFHPVHSGQKLFKCDQCDKTFSESSHLITHKRIHSGEKPFKCNQCDKAFSDSSNFIKHKRVHSGVKPFKCDQCDKAFADSSNLFNHKRIHSAEKPFKCDQCNKAFSESQRLVNHKRTHSGNGSLKCDQCNKAFTQSCNLIRHKRMHSGEKPFICDQCNKAFSDSTNLINHKRIHFGEKPFKCDQCNKAFAQSSNLVRHKRVHSGDKSFKCDK